ncbi:PEP-CTERM sorting domain-containing protein [Nostoc sp. TCL26-01]|uniref:PEP-CTERM sorting domain-containing protein n=1 Tax=Nostoc sp. TCL26-01 TaxID=2576904 RepID=UPI0015B9AAB8|nr:PEP-CTERM sorting domain-containing protein [Nostoc sp. TCL26-01]QLE56124.1 PEP-CTERM sorting domain-containing protein [Nostoc sp. TCL26-01]
MKLTQNFGIATFAIAISLATVEVKPTQAAVIDYKFTVNATSGSQYFGSLRYDDTNLNGIGAENLDVSNGLLSVVFDYLGTQYTEVDDFDYISGVAPFISFQDGKLLGLSYLVEDQFFIGGDLNTPSTGGDKFYTILSADLLSANEAGTVSYSKVPEPLALFGTAIATVTGLLVNRQKKASASN